MPHSMRALLGVVIVGWSCCHAAAEDTSPTWWPFGRQASGEIAQPPAASAGNTAAPSGETNPTAAFDGHRATPDSADESEQRWMVNSQETKISWPRIHLPEFPKPSMPPAPWLAPNEPDPQRNAWMDGAPEPTTVTPMQAVRNGAQRVRQRTRSAWNKTVAALTPGDDPHSSYPSSRVAHHDRPSVWQRMFGTDAPARKEGSQTVAEFMAQDRIDP